MFKDCKNCNQSFEITDDDLKFYEKVSLLFNDKKYLIPAPTLCPDCRQQRRLSFRNERNLYKRKCDLCKKDIISLYSPDKNFTIYCPDCWWSDRWDPLSYGQHFDSNKSFFEQCNTLYDKVPKISLILLGDNKNSDYTNDNMRLKNCYLIFDGEQAVDSQYGETFIYLKDCMDFLFLESSELTYECINCLNCYNIKYSRYSQSCSNSAFLVDCSSCTNCFGCVNLHQKEYHIFNQAYSQEEYEEKIKLFGIEKYSNLGQFKKVFEGFCSKQAKKFFRGIMNDNVNGDNLVSCKDTFESFDCNNLRDCKFCTNMLMGANDCYDINIWGNNTSLAYDSACIGEGSTNTLFSYYAAFNVSNIYYCIFCTRGCSNLFSCVGLTHKNYCILNKQYTKEEYEELVPKIIEHMTKNGEFGEFFPSYMSAFGYNETVAQEYFPLTKNDAIAKGFKWSDFEPEFPVVEKIIPANLLPDSISEIPDDILNWAVQCENTGKPFRFIKPELDFYRKMNLPIPHLHPDQRHKDRMALRNPRKLFDRKCMKCNAKIKTTYAKDRPEIVYCEKCYLKEIF